MGREIRRVPPNWQHPKKDFFNFRKGFSEERYQPMYDRPFAPVMREWFQSWESWERGERPEHCREDDKNLAYWEWDCGPPDPLYYQPEWKPEEMTWYQVYETVTQGTPVTPAFATPEELIDYLATHGDFWDQLRVREGRREGPAAWGKPAAEQFVRRGFAFSLMVKDGQVFEPRDGLEAQR